MAETNTTEIATTDIATTMQNMTASYEPEGKFNFYVMNSFNNVFKPFMISMLFSPLLVTIY